MVAKTNAPKKWARSLEKLQPDSPLFLLRQVEVRVAVDAVDVAVEGVPQHLREEGKPEFAFDVNDLFKMSHLQLLLDREAGKKDFFINLRYQKG